MRERKWKSGARGCWWAIVPKHEDSLHPLPWCCGSTRVQAWRAWREWLGSYGVAENYKAIKVFLTPESPYAE